mmetsp:Transcript_37040/g.87643  ORF Transcript_37040/g.87643 Transcript_37040/m.87643 type:complete len:276 (-) Transcript_37040:206-1033(-)
MAMTASLSSSEVATAPPGNASSTCSTLLATFPKKPVFSTVASSLKPSGVTWRTRAFGTRNDPFIIEFALAARVDMDGSKVRQKAPRAAGRFVLRNSARGVATLSTLWSDCMDWCRRSSSATRTRRADPCIAFRRTRMSTFGTSSTSACPGTAGPAAAASAAFCSACCASILSSRASIPDTKLPVALRCFASSSTADSTARMAAASFASRSRRIFFSASGSFAPTSRARIWAFCARFAELSVCVMASGTLLRFFSNLGASPDILNPCRNVQARPKH